MTRFYLDTGNIYATTGTVATAPKPDKTGWMNTSRHQYNNSKNSSTTRVIKPSISKPT